ncbi:GmrSD restriction endonuclease domain-containing protein [Microbacterium hydrocarbonoxydans]|uniref:GmrSD restriction endonuclease domain-containing protein n=1 Tax=Microbacterium hydrocarbonoxydans TaxID=273678 RepID=UPI00203CEEEE|nr:DUF262 domain-containing protein [Microbacterium hydrocarbonoxydans]MCM3779661.1 DUF262 domain-containing protein [Microbacterium hydrocarbonoxydans]
MSAPTDDAATEPVPSPRETHDESFEAEGVELLDIDPQDEIVATTYEITSYGADYDVEGLIRRMNKNDIIVPSFEPSQPGIEVGAFQRGFVWRKTQMSRFIESLLLGLPVPGIFLVKDRDNRLLVLDGQQRLRSLQRFYDGKIDDRTFRLIGVQPPFEGQSYQDLRPEDRRRLDDSIIHATVLRDESTSGTQDAVYSIYERLNTGGSPLQPQEIRIALYEGDFLRGIARLNEDACWRNLYGPRSTRFRDHELILRAIALHEWQDQYRKPLKTFLNAYLNDHRNDVVESGSGVGKLFIDAVHATDSTIGKPAFRPERALNVAFADSVIVGVMRRLNTGKTFAEGELERAYQTLVADEDFTAATTVRTSDEDYVNLRLDKATAAFAG